MRPDECLIRYKGGRNALRVHGIGRVIYDGGPSAVRWVEDSDDLLLMAAADAAFGTHGCRPWRMTRPPTREAIDRDSTGSSQM
jgi:hypothetical protein